MVFLSPTIIPGNASFKTLDHLRPAPTVNSKGSPSYWRIKLLAINRACRCSEPSPISPVLTCYNRFLKCYSKFCRKMVPAGLTKLTLHIWTDRDWMKATSSLTICWLTLFGSDRKWQKILTLTHENVHYPVRVDFSWTVLHPVSQSNHFQAINPGWSRNRTGWPFPLLEGKSVAVFANHTSLVGKYAPGDHPAQLGIRVVKIFEPEHGFKGTASGEKNKTRSTKNWSSAHGDHKKPTRQDLADVWMVVFGHSGCWRTLLHLYLLIAVCDGSGAGNHKPLLILTGPTERFWRRRPVLDRSFSSFVGMQPVPTVYGMTIGEYALMLTKEMAVRQGQQQHKLVQYLTNPTPDDTLSYTGDQMPQLWPSYPLYIAGFPSAES